MGLERLLAGGASGCCRRCAAALGDAVVPRYCDSCIAAVGEALVAALAWDVDERGPGWIDAARELAALLERMGRAAEAASVGTVIPDRPRDA